jgi:hypothetical protein
MRYLKFTAAFAMMALMLLVLSACGGDSATATPAPPPPTNTPAAPKAATAEEIQLIGDSITATKGLSTYHFTMKASGDVFTQAIDIEGDYVAPDKVYAKGMVGGENGEQLKTGGKSYKKVDGKWVEQAAAVPGGAPVDPTSKANILESLSDFVNAGSNYQNVGTDTMNGATLTHYTGELDATKMGGGGLPPGMGTIPPLGKVYLWIDP